MFYDNVSQNWPKQNLQHFRDSKGRYKVKTAFYFDQ